MTGLLDLPAELIASIFQHLDHKDVFATRLWQQVHRKLISIHFGKRFFRKKGYLITTPSINVLKSIADHEELRKYVQHIWFNPDCYTFVVPKCQPEEDLECDDAEDENDHSSTVVVEHVGLLSEEDRRRYEAYKACMEDHGMLLYNENLERRLIGAFANLPNLQAVGMRRSEDHQPWGWSRLKDAIGEDPRVLGPIPWRPKYTLSGPTRLFMAIVKAMAYMAVEVKRLYTDAIEIDNILPDTLPQRTLDATCRALLYLEVNVNMAWLKARSNTKYIILREEAEYGEGLLRLLSSSASSKRAGSPDFSGSKAEPYGATHSSRSRQLGTVVSLHRLSETGRQHPPQPTDKAEARENHHLP